MRVGVKNESKHKVTKVKTYLYYRVDINEDLVKTGLVDDLFEERLLLPREVYDKEFVVAPTRELTKTFSYTMQDNFTQLDPAMIHIGYDPRDTIVHSRHRRAACARGTSSSGCPTTPSSAWGSRWDAISVSEFR